VFRGYKGMAMSMYKVSICGDPCKNIWWPSLKFLDRPNEDFFWKFKVSVVVGRGGTWGGEKVS